MSRLAQAVFVVLAVLCVILAGPATAEIRVALVIGNSSYLSPNALANPARDARAVAEALRQARFNDVTLAVNLDNRAFQNALKSFARKAEGADVALVYYAGHGLELNGTNYLVPVDASLTSASDLSFETVTLDQVMTAVNGATRLKVVVLDACRSNPFVAQMTHGSRGMRGGGLARVQPEPDMLVAYAAREGTTAADGDGGHSPYTTAFINRLTSSRAEIRILFGQVSDDVRAATHGAQEPAVYTSLGGTEFYLNTALSGPLPVAPRRAEPSLAPASPTLSVTDAVTKARAAFGRRDFRQSMVWYREAADRGNTDAQVQVGFQYENALGVEQNYAEAAAWYRRAAEQGNAVAQSNLGTLYLNGHGVSRDYAEAIRWLRKSADQGYASAQANLGALYGNGNGAPRNYVIAIGWLRKAAAQDEPFAEANLAYFYAHGLGTPRDPAEARKWYAKAAAAGNESAKQWLAQHPGG